MQINSHCYCIVTCVGGRGRAEAAVSLTDGYGAAYISDLLHSVTAQLFIPQALDVGHVCSTARHPVLGNK